MDLLLLTPVDPLSYQIIPDLGLMYLASAAREAGFSVDIRDLRREGVGIPEAVNALRSLNPSVVGIKCYSNEVSRVAGLAAAARGALPDCAIVAGGPHPSMDPEGTLRRMPKDMLLRLHRWAYVRFYFERWRLFSLPGQLKSKDHLKVISRRVKKIF